MSYFNKSPHKDAVNSFDNIRQGKENSKPNSANYLCALRHSRSEKLGRL